MLLPIRESDVQRTIPAVATSNQFVSALGNPRKILQRVMISAIGGSITLVISQSQITSQFYSLWLILGVVILLYILWGPILEASRRNSSIRKYPFTAIFEGEISKIFTKEKVEKSHEQANSRGELELIENRRTFLILEISDEDGYLGEISCPMENKFESLREGLIIRCLVFSNKSDFSTVPAISDAWIPELRIWFGDYPYLLKPAFEDLCRLRLR